tara:strand:- start:297 stop:530 length:234 start_codon:yes stop_codon:yes gene_type:complete
MNNLLLSLIISTISTGMIICSTYKDNKYKTNDYIKIFIIILSGSFLVNLFNKNNVDIKTEVISPRLGNIENIAKPPF